MEKEEPQAGNRATGSQASSGWRGAQMKPRRGNEAALEPQGCTHEADKRHLWDGSFSWIKQPAAAKWRIEHKVAEVGNRTEQGRRFFSPLRFWRKERWMDESLIPVAVLKFAATSMQWHRHGWGLLGGNAGVLRSNQLRKENNWCEQEMS